MISVVITAAGNSTRFGENKLLLNLEGKPLIVRTVEQFVKCDRIDDIVVATRKEDIPLYHNLFHSYQLNVVVVEGGKERIQSLYQGVKATKGDIILTHDGARPFTPVRLIKRLIDAVQEFGAAMTAIHPVATIKHAGNDRIILNSLPRDSTWIAQTPQGFKREILLSSLESAIAQHYFVATDDSEIVALAGHQVKIVEGDHINMKITVKEDLAIAKEFCKIHQQLAEDLQLL